MYQNRKRSFSETDLALKSKAKSDVKNSKKRSELKRKKTEKNDDFSNKDLSSSKIHKLANSNRKSRKALTATEVDHGNLKKIIAQGRHGNSIVIRTSRFNSKNINVLTLQNQYVVQNQANLGYFFSNSTAFKVIKCLCRKFSCHTQANINPGHNSELYIKHIDPSNRCGPMFTGYKYSMHCHPQ